MIMIYYNSSNMLIHLQRIACDARYVLLRSRRIFRMNADLGNSS